MPRKPRTLLEVCVARLGARRGGFAAAWLIEHALAYQEFGRVPTAVEYAEWAFISERAAWQRRASLREVFGDEWKEVAERLVADVDSRESRRRLVRLPLPA
jgi:hypothetical protein